MDFAVTVTDAPPAYSPFLSRIDEVQSTGCAGGVGFPTSGW